jgi:transcription-repair coupling factor (superfamily II helicase)
LDRHEGFGFGAGTLLGNKQSGNISAVGFSLYTQLLSQAVEEQKAKMSGVVKGPQPVRLPAPTIDLPLRAYLPDDYISDIDTRLSIYQKLTEINLVEQVEDLARELKDRFGDIPEEAQNLLFVLKLKALGSKAMIESISTGDNIINIHVFPGCGLTAN